MAYTHLELAVSFAATAALALIVWGCGDGVSTALDRSAAPAPGPSLDAPAGQPSSSQPAPGPGLGEGSVGPGASGVNGCPVGDVACLCDYLVAIIERCGADLPGDLRDGCDHFDALDVDLSACEPSAEVCWGRVHDVLDCFAESCGGSRACFEQLDALDGKR